MLARAVVLIAAIGVSAFGLYRGTWAVGGSDSSCYALMADALAQGRWQPATALALEAPWPDPSRTFAPGGFIPSSTVPDAASPICTPGFAVLLAPLRALAGRDAIFYLTPLAGLWLVWLTYVLGGRLSGVLGGTLAAILVAATPVLLFQVVQPMNDITVAALWTAALVMLTKPHRAESRARVLRANEASAALMRVGAAGLVAGIAVFVRPNLAPIALVMAAWLAMVHDARWRAAFLFAVAVAPGVAATAVFNDVLYGHPLASGYGNAGDLFAVRHIAANLRNYGSAILETQLGFPLIALAAPFVIDVTRRSIAWLIVGITGVVSATYLLYTPFPEWWYLRFFLPVLPMTTALAAAVIVKGARRPAAAVLVAMLVAAVMLNSSATGQAADLHRLEHRFRATAEVVERRLPDNAVFITVWESGGIRYHAGRQAIMWDALAPDWLDRSLAWLQARGLEPFIVIEEWEEPLFRQRFGGHADIAALDWPPRFQIERQVRIYDPRDRARYLAGDGVPTETILPPRR